MAFYPSMYRRICPNALSIPLLSFNSKIIKLLFLSMAKMSIEPTSVGYSTPSLPFSST